MCHGEATLKARTRVTAARGPKGDIVAGPRSGLRAALSSPMRSRGVTQGLAAASSRGPTTELWPVAPDTRQHASSFNPLPGTGPRSAFFPSSAFHADSRGFSRFSVRTIAIRSYGVIHLTGGILGKLYFRLSGTVSVLGMLLLRSYGVIGYGEVIGK